MKRKQILALISSSFTLTVLSSPFFDQLTEGILAYTRPVGCKQTAFSIVSFHRFLILINKPINLKPSLQKRNQTRNWHANTELWRIVQNNCDPPDSVFIDANFNSE